MAFSCWEKIKKFPIFIWWENRPFFIPGCSLVSEILKFSENAIVAVASGVSCPVWPVAL